MYKEYSEIRKWKEEVHKVRSEWEDRKELEFRSEV